MKSLDKFLVMFGKVSKSFEKVWKSLGKLFKFGSLVGSAIKNMGLFSKIPIDFKIETMDF